MKLTLLSAISEPVPIEMLREDELKELQHAVLALCKRGRHVQPKTDGRLPDLKSVAARHDERVDFLPEQARSRQTASSA